MQTLHHKNTLTGCMVLIMFAAFATPVHAQYAVHVVEDTSQTMRNTTISAAMNTKLFGIETAEEFREEILDKIAWQLAQTMLTTIVSDLTQWVSSGFQGNPTFITDFTGFVRNSVDEAAGDFIYGTELGFLCSPFELDIRAALAIQHQQGALNNFQPQCSLSQIQGNVENFLSGSFQDGGWPGWFELTQGGYNDPTLALIESEAAFEARLRTARGDAYLQYEISNFLDIEVCETVESVHGPKEECKTSTPGRIVEDQLNHTLGLSKDKLVVADEINELVGALISQIANQAIMGVGGLLGLGGNPSYSNNSYGSSGESSYLEAIGEENSEMLGRDSTGGSSNPFQNAIVTQQKYIALQQDIVNQITVLEDDIANYKSKYPSCFSVELPGPLRRALTDARAEIAEKTAAIEQLGVLRNQYNNAASAEEQVELVSELRRLQTNGEIAQEFDLVEVELYIDFELQDDLDAAAALIQQERTRCEIQENSSSGGSTGGAEGPSH